MKNNKLIYWLSGFVVLLIVFALIAKKQGWIGNSSGKLVATEKAQLRSIVETVTASGKLTPLTEVKLSSEVSGEVIVLNVQEGDSVKQGQLLAEINPSIYESLVTQAEAALNQMRASRSSAKASSIQAKAQYNQALTNFNRNKTLHAQKVISDSEFEAAKLQLEQADAGLKTAEEQVNGASFNISSAEAQVKQAKENLLKTKIYAPIGGIVSLVNVKLGERVVGTAQMTGTEIIRLADLENMLIQVDVNENDVLRVHLNDTADVEVDAYLGKKFKATVNQIAYSSSSASSLVSSQATNFTVKLTLLKDSYKELIDIERGLRYPFRPGMSATVDVKTASKNNVLTVPIQSVTIREEEDSKEKRLKDVDNNTGATTDKKKVKEMVFTIDKNKVKAIEVKTGIQDANYIEIVEGLKDNSEVVKAPFKAITKTLKDGDLIKIVSEKELFKNQEEEE
jgi:HlyD family secretion protein